MKEAPDNVWFQMYCTTDERINDDLVRRAAKAGVRVLTVSVDVPVNSNRERNKRNGFTRPLRMTPGVMLDAMAHPAWVLRYLRAGGIPMMQNWQPYAPPGASAPEVADMYGTLTPAPDGAVGAPAAHPRSLVRPAGGEGPDASGGRAQGGEHRRGWAGGIQPRRPPARCRALAAGSAAGDPRRGRRRRRTDPGQRRAARLRHRDRPLPGRASSRSSGGPRCSAPPPPARPASRA